MSAYNKNSSNSNIDISLNRKIIQNENKLQNLFHISNKKRINHSTDQKGISKEKHLEMLRKIKNQRRVLNYSTDFQNGYDNNYNDDDHPLQKNLSQYFSPKPIIDDDDLESINEKQVNVIKVNQKIKKIKNTSNKTSRTNIHSNYNINKNKSKNKYRYKKVEVKPKKNLNISVRNNNRSKMHSNLNNSNSNTLHKDYSTIDYSVKSDRCFSPSAKSLNLEEMMDRFQKDENKKKEWLENQKKKKEEEEKKQCSHAPKINKVSKKINLKIKDDFFERQKKRDEQKKKKEEKLKEFLNKKKEEEINKNNPLLNKKNKRKNKDLNSSTISTKTLDKHKKEDINNTISKLYEWDKKRKEKINQKRKKKDEKYEEIDHIPKINKRSASMAEFNKRKYNEKNIYNRLAQKDPVILEKRKLLEELYTPSFKPNINTKKVKHKEVDENYENEETDRKEESYLNTKGMGITKLSEKNIRDDDIQELYRNAIFHNNKKHIRSKSIE